MQTAAGLQKKEQQKGRKTPATRLEEKGVAVPAENIVEPGVPLFLQRLAVAPVQNSEEDEDLIGTPVLPKLSVGAPDDEYEREADRVAATIMGMEDVHDSTKGPMVSGPHLQSDTERIGETEDDLPSINPGIVQGKVKGDGAFTSDENVEAIHTQCDGCRLPNEVESRISHVLRADLSHVRVHDDHAANRAAHAINAVAFTHRNHIYLGEKQSAGDTKLMAHEAAHVVQQGAAHSEAQESLRAPRTGSYPLSPAGSHTLQRKNRFRRVPAEPPQTVAQINAMTLSDFQEFTLRQLDWATSRHLTTPAAATDLANFRQVLSFSYEPDILATCGDMPVGQIIAAGLSAALVHLRDYARGAVSTRSTAWLRLTNNVAQAVAWGTDLPVLEGACSRGTLNLIMPPPSPLTNPSVFEQLETVGRPADFSNYVTTCSPVLSATNGREIESYLALWAEGADPAAYFGRITYVRNFHRFTKPALDGIVSNERVTAASQQSILTRRPLTLVLYSALDHNGAFHRLPGITNLILQPDILTIILEGLGTLGAYEANIAPIAARYGIDGRIDQAMIAGHGSPTGIELAGTQSGGTVQSERLENAPTSPHRTATENLIDRLVNNMSADPAQRRIVLYACLTASHEVDPTGIDPSNPARASTQIRNAISANPNIRDFVASRAGAGATVIGSQASQWATGFLTPGTLFTHPRLTLQTPHDRFITASKLQYVEFGPECGGAVRALVECWAADYATSTPGTACRDAVSRRIGRPPTTIWDEQIVRGIFDIALHRYWTNGNMLATFVNITDWLSYLEDDLDHPQGANLWNNVGSRLNAADVGSIFTALAPTTTWTGEARVRLIFNQTWMRHDATKQADFLAALGTFASCGDVRRYAHMPLVRPNMNSILPATPAANPPAHELIIAIMEAADNPVATPEPTPLPRHIDYLRALLGTATNFPSALNISGVASGLTTEDAILTAIGRSPSQPVSAGTTTGPTGAPLPAANVDLNGDGVNDFYLEPFLHRGTVDNCRRLNVRSRPSMSRVVATIARNQVVRIVGRHRDWYGIEHNGRIRFVHKDFITIAP